MSWSEIPSGQSSNPRQEYRWRRSSNPCLKPHCGRVVLLITSCFLYGYSWVPAKISFGGFLWDMLSSYVRASWDRLRIRSTRFRPFVLFKMFYYFVLCSNHWLGIFLLACICLVTSSRGPVQLWLSLFKCPSGRLISCITTSHSIVIISLSSTLEECISQHTWSKLFDVRNTSFILNLSFSLTSA